MILFNPYPAEHIFIKFLKSVDSDQLASDKNSMITIINYRQTCGTTRKRHTTITRHIEDKISKATSSLFPIKMIAKLEWTLSNAQQNIEQLQNPTMGGTINNRTNALERTAA